jgi:8-oxo-dGTP pyrophosphatase MutT (NUDIX family)
MVNVMINFETKNGVFNLRAAGLCFKGNKVLFAYHDNVKSYSLPGGRCELGEDSKSAVVREFKEETGVDVKVLDKHFLIENFFMFGKVKYHEILIIHLVKFPEDSEFYKHDRFVGYEKEKPMDYRWVGIDDLEKYKVKPDLLLKLIQNHEKYSYTIVRDVS